MSGCLGFLPAGNNKDCLKTAGNLKMPIFTDTDVVFDDIYSVMELSNWAPFIVGLQLFSAPLYDYENGTEDPNVISAFSTDKVQTNNPQIAYSFFLKVNQCDWYNVMQAFNGNTYRMFENYQSGAISGTKAEEKIKGYLVDAYATFKGAMKDDFNVYKVDVYFKETEGEVKENGIIWKPNFNFASSYNTIAPLSSSMMVVTPYVAGDQSVQVNVCGGAPKTGLLTADFEVIKSDPAGVTVAAAAGVVDGQYVMTTTPALVDYQYAEIRVKKGTPVTDVSNRLRIKGVTP